MWFDFNSNKDYVYKQYKDNLWNENSGMSPENLKLECEKIVQENEGQSRSIIKARVFEYILANAQIYVSPFDFFTEKINHCNIISDLRSVWREGIENTAMQNVVKSNKSAETAFAYTADVDFSHVVPDWDNILNFGICGIYNKINIYLEKSNLTSEQKDFYLSCRIVYGAILNYIERLKDEAERLSKDNGQMTLLAESLNNLMNNPPQNLHEAFELSLIFYYLQTYVECENVRSMGALDQLYYKFYINDIKCGRYTQEQIAEFIRYYFYKMYSINAIANTAFCLCAADENGNTVINELTYLFLKVYGELKIADPKIHIRYNEDIPDELLNIVFELIKSGNNSICFLNDNVVVKGLEKIGIETLEAKRYIPVGCYEPAAYKKEIPCSCAGRINMLKAVECAVNNGFDMISGEKIGLSEIDNNIPESFSEFVECVKRQLAYFADKTIEKLNAYENNYIEINPSPMFSAAFDECMDRGVDVYSGGCKYNNTSIDLLGIASMADSLAAIKRLVYEEELISFEEFAKILRDDWKDNEKLRLKCKNLCPKFGNDIDEVDNVTAELIDDLACYINKRKNGRGGVYRCGIFSIDWYTFFGAATGASADGRFAKEPVSKNLCANIGKDKNGVTGLINSVTKIDFSNIPNGAVLDVMLHPTAVSGDCGNKVMKGLLDAYMRSGGLAFQCNVLNADTLKDAQENPENYETLQVRLCGWNVYFVNLSKKEQDEFIKMAENVV